MLVSITNSTMEIIEILGLTVEELKEKLLDCNLHITGTKAELQCRMIKYYQHTTVPEEEGSEMTTQTELNNGQLHSTGKTTFSFADIEGSTKSFSGGNEENVNSWIAEFEEISHTVGWSELQKYIFGKRLLQGPAKLFVHTLKNVSTWERLKERLRSEFETTINSAELHKLLENRKIKKTETIREYVYQMQETASKGDIEDEALIQYIIEGINEKGHEKLLLYGAANIEELKQKIVIYEKVKKQSITTVPTHSNEPRINKYVSTNKTREMKCFICGDNNHYQRNCPKKVISEIKCYKCLEIGHKSYQCDKKKPETTYLKKETFIAQNNGCRTKVIVNNKSEIALIDTGAEVSFMNEDLVKRLNIKNLKESKIVLHGLGGDVKTIGQCLIHLNLDNQYYPLKTHIIPNGLISDSLVIGRNILNQAEITIGPDQIKVVPLKQSREMDQRDQQEAIVNTCEIGNTNVSIEHVKNWQIRQQLTNRDNDGSKGGEREETNWRSGYRHNLADTSSQSRHRGFGDLFAKDRGFGDRRRRNCDDRKRDDAPKKRPKLNLQPRTIPIENLLPLPSQENKEDIALEDEYDASKKIKPRPTTVSAATIFGSAKPDDTAAREREIKNKLKMKRLAAEKKKEKDDDDDQEKKKDITVKDQKRPGKGISWRNRTNEKILNDNDRKSTTLNQRRKFNLARRDPQDVRKNDDRRTQRGGQRNGRDDRSRYDGDYQCNYNYTKGQDGRNRGLQRNDDNNDDYKRHGYYRDEQRSFNRRKNLGTIIDGGEQLCTLTKYIKGPYKVVHVGKKDRYIALKIGKQGGPNKTTTVADLMRPWGGLENVTTRVRNDSSLEDGDGVIRGE